jgi:Abnormal spindle-like microcephaly-assoc'd, ASPM-SPD-2-Hydin
MYYRDLPPQRIDPQNLRMLFLPQCISRTLFSLAVCVSTIFAPRALALAENQPVGAPVSHTARTQLRCAVTRLQLGEVAVGQTGDKLMTITNSGRTRLVVLSAASTGTEFGLNELDLPLTLAAGESFTFRVTFAPQTSGPADGSISIVSGAPRQTLTIHLAGTGRAAGRLEVNPRAIDFGDASVGSAATQTGQLTASGASVTVSSAAISGEGFQLGGLSLPVTITAGHSVPFTVTFVPRDSSSSSAILSFASDATNSPSEQDVTLRVVSPAQHKVQLSWKASTSKHILGYNVYRGNRSGGPYKKINGVLDTNTRFTDLTVAAGHKYYYVATAVNSRKRESIHSKQIRVVIP